jgi:hypothetical protein
MALGCGLTSVRGNRGKFTKMNRWFPKNIQRYNATFEENRFFTKISENGLFY